MTKTSWILKSGEQSLDCSSFPYAFKAAFNAVRKAIEEKKNPSPVMKGITIVGPPNVKGERVKYSYATACELARSQGLLTADGQINSKEFRRR